MAQRGCNQGRAAGSTMVDRAAGNAIGLNRHRRLHPGALTQRYRRVRRALQMGAAPGADACDPAELHPHDDDYDWDGHDEPFVDEQLLFRAWHERLRAESSLGGLLGQRLAAQVSRARMPKDTAPAAADTALDAADAVLDALPAAAETLPAAAETLPAALHEHVQHLLSGPDLLSQVGGARAAAVLAADPASRAALPRIFPLFQEVPGALVLALLFAPFWIRPLSSWTVPAGQPPTRRAESLARHLFVRYPVPACAPRLFAAAPFPPLKWVCWTVLLGQGGSLARAARRFGWQLPPRLVPHLFSAPADLSPVEACMWAELAHLGGGRTELGWLRDNPSYVVDLTDGAEGPLDLVHAGRPAWRGVHAADAWDQRLRSFWRDTAAWLVRHRDALDDRRAALLLEWAMHRFTEHAARGGPAFRWRGRTPHGALALATEYQRLRLLPYAALEWRGRGWDWADACDGAGAAPRWTVRELTSGQALYEEGQALRHCVAGYARRCAAGDCAIFSLQCDDQRRLTIEIAPAGRRIIQARGACNRPATPEEQGVVQKWLGALDRGVAGACAGMAAVEPA